MATFLVAAKLKDASIGKTSSRKFTLAEDALNKAFFKVAKKTI